MDIHTFKEKTLESHVTFEDPVLLCLYLIRQKKWEEAHNIAQEMHSRLGAWLHGFLHKIEGDTWNAKYWYRQAGEPFTNQTEDEEWNYITSKYFDSFAP